MDLVERLKAARRVAVPIVMVESPDPAQTVEVVRQAFEFGAKTPIPIVQWDAMNGLAALNKAGFAVMSKIIGNDEDGKPVDPEQWPALTANPGSALAMMQQVPGELFDEKKELTQRGSIVFMLNAHRYFRDEPGVQNGQIVQGIWNTRDAFKQNRRTLVLVVPLGVKLPAELAQDVIVLEESYPDDAALKAVVSAQTKASALPDLKPAALAGAVDALRGLSAFAAEQITAMSLTKDGLDIDELWQRKIKVIEATDGFGVDKGDETLDDVRGAANFTDFSGRMVRSKRSPTLYVRIDEIEKAFAGLGTKGGAGDNTGITQDRLRTMLTYMEDEGWTGFILLGHAGCGKTLLTKALANTASRVVGRRILSLSLDLEATSSSAAGEAGARMRRAMKLLKSLAAGGRVCIVATCNGVDELPPALKRRFKLGTWMADLPEREEKDAMWLQYTEKYGLKVGAKNPLPDDTDWTGADIRNVCDTADNLECTLKEACQFTTFIAKSDPDAITKLRKFADGRLVSVSRPGTYKAPFTDRKFAEPAARAARRGEE